MNNIVSPLELLRKLNIENTDEIDLEAIACICGASVVYEELQGCEAFIAGLGEEAIITVNSNSSPGRQRFSIAHELGHWMRDRKTSIFNCTEQSYTCDWAGNSAAVTAEQRANKFAAELLIPEFMFLPKVKNAGVSMDEISRLAKDFRTSLTSTAIRFAELCPKPVMVMLYSKDRRRWFVRGREVPKEFWPLDRLDKDSFAYELLNSNERRASGQVDASSWINIKNADEYSLQEDSIKFSESEVLSLIWWKNENQILDFDDEEEDSEVKRFPSRYR